MKIFIGDILQLSKRSPKIFVHQVNCRRIANAGLAGAIRKKWPHWYSHFYREKTYLGRTDIFKVDVNIWIASLYAQEGFGSGKCFTDYEAFEKCLEALREYVAVNPYSVYFPYGIGCGLAGGYWKIVFPLLEKHFPEANIIRLPESTEL